MNGADAGPARCASPDVLPVAGSRTRAGWYAIVLLGLMFTLPLVQPRHTNPITSFYSEWLAFVLGAAAMLTLVLRRYAAPMRVPGVAFVPVLLAGIAVAHLLAVKSAYPQQPLIAAVYLLWSAALVLTAAAMRREFGLQAMTTLLAGFMLAGGLANTLAGILQYYDWRGPFESIIATKLSDQVYGNLGQPNHFATHVTLALASLGLLRASGRLALRWTIIAAVPMLFVLSLSGSRSAWVYLVAIALLTIVRYGAMRTPEARSAMAFALALLPGLAAAHFVAQMPWLQPATLHTTIIDRVFALAGTTSERLQLWREAWAMFKSAPLTGVGWGDYAWHHFMLNGRDGPALTGLYNHAHNLILQLLAETGIVGAGVVVAGVVVWSRNSVGILKQASGLWIWACAIVLGIHSMLEYPLWNAHFLGIAAVVLGLGDASTFHLRRTGLVRLGVVVFVAGGISISAVMLQSYYRLESVVHGHYTDSDTAALDRAHRDMAGVTASFFLAPYVELAYARDIDLSSVLLESKLAFTTRVMHFAPTGLVAYRHAALNALSGRETQARAILHQAVLAYPRVLDSFTEEFASSATGSAEAQARFLAELRALQAERSRKEVTPQE